MVFVVLMAFFSLYHVVINDKDIFVIIVKYDILIIIFAQQNLKKILFYLQMSSQVPYLEEYIKEPYVFTIDMSNTKKLRKILTHIKTKKVRWKEENFGIYFRLSLEWESLYTAGYFRPFLDNKPAFHNLSIILRINTAKNPEL